MLASNRDEWATRLNEEWHEQLNSAKTYVPNDEMCKCEKERKKLK
jgi:hypothetical protein